MFPTLKTMLSGPAFCLLLGVSSDHAQLITHQVTEVACPVIGEAQPELTPSKRQKRILNMIFKAGFHFAGRTFDSQSEFMLENLC